MRAANTAATATEIPASKGKDRSYRRWLPHTNTRLARYTMQKVAAEAVATRTR